MYVYVCDSTPIYMSCDLQDMWNKQQTQGKHLYSYIFLVSLYVECQFSDHMDGEHVSI